MNRLRAAQCVFGIVISVFLGAALNTTPTRAATPFVHEEVEEGIFTSLYTSLEIDANGNPHISYHGNTILKYAVKVGGNWVFETVDAIDEVGQYTSLELDAQGNPHISYRDQENNNLKYALKTGGIWSLEVVDATASVGLYTSLALDAQGYPRISYYDATNGDLKYAANTGGGWTLQTIDATGLVGGYTSLVLDGDGNPHISYRDFTNTDLKYARNIEGDWLIETVDASGDVGGYTSLALGGDGNPHISYYDYSNADLRYAVRSGGNWMIDTVDATGSVGWHTSMRLDSEGNPHVCYTDETNDDLKYAVKSGGNWTIEAVDAAGSVGRFTSLALDAEGNPRISYQDFHDNDNLKYTDAAIHLTSPSGGEQWPVGGVRSIDWNGAGLIDILVSVDGGNSFNVVKSSLSSGTPTGGSFDLLVPHTPSRFCVVKIERTTPFATSTSDSFFTIEASVSLLNLFVYQPEALPGLTVSWNTDPGPKDLAGYRLEKKRGTNNYVPLSPRTSDTSYHDADGRAGDTYRLFAINGLGEESYLGETSSERAPSLRGGLAVYPLPYRNGELSIEFSNTMLGGEPLETEVSVYDVIGRKVRTVARGYFSGTTHRTTWDGVNDRGNPVASGTYFVRVATDLGSRTTKFVIVR